MPRLSRRKLLRSAVQGAAGLSLGIMGLGGAHRAGAQQGDRSGPGLASGFHVLSAGDTNVLAVSSGDGLALVDGGSAAGASALADRLARLPGGGNVHTLFNTHWHPDHTGSNAALARAGATIVSHVNTRLWLSTDVTWPWSDSTVEPLPAAALPNRTFYSEEELTVGDRRVLCGHLRDFPHTDGDIYVFFPDDNVMAIGDAVSGAGWPEIDWWTGGWIGGMVGATEALLEAVDADSRIVPAEGAVQSRTALEAQLELCKAAMTQAAATYRAGGTLEDYLAAASGLGGRRGDPTLFLTLVYEGGYYHSRELGGIV